MEGSQLFTNSYRKRRQINSNTVSEEKLNNVKRMKKYHNLLPRVGCSFNMESLGEEITSMFLLNSLESNDFCIIDNFLEQELSSTICRTTKYLYKALPGLFAPPAGRESKFRDDVSCWLKGSEAPCKAFSHLNIKLVNLMKKLIQEYKHTDKSLKLSQKSRLQISCFPSGSHGYKAHIDNPNKNGRILSMVYFPNEFYDRNSHGGVSRFFVKNKTECVDIEPICNRLVVYWSDRRVISETLPTNKNIFSISCWYFGEQTNNDERSSS